MKTLKPITLYVLAVCFLFIAGCSEKEKADETKPVEEVKAQAEKMSVKNLRSTAMEYKNAITAKQAEIQKIAVKLKDIPPAQMLSDEAKNIKSELEELNKSISALSERFQIYYNKLKEKGGDLSGL